MAESGWAYPYVTVDSFGIETIANDKLTNTSKPAATLNNKNADGEKLMSKPITQMAVNADGLASFVFMDDESSSIHPILMNTAEAQGQKCGIRDGWHLLDGRRLSGKPTTRGLYLYHGQKVFIP